MSLSIEQQFEEKLKKLSSDFEFFAHVTSHDLRDPLRQARIETDELLEKIPQEYRTQLNTANKLIDEVLEKIAILRDFSYIANDKSKRTPVDLNKLLADIITEFVGKVNPADIKTAKLPTINGNALHLRRVFFALLDNAIKFHNTGEKLQIEINAHDEGGLWHFTIADNGIGLDKVYRELVFVLFQKLDTDSKNAGYGAGLAFARKIVENHGGTIWYESDGEHGTIFHFTLKA